MVPFPKETTLDIWRRYNSRRTLYIYIYICAKCVRFYFIWFDMIVWCRTSAQGWIQHSHEKNTQQHDDAVARFCYKCLLEFVSESTIYAQRPLFTCDLRGGRRQWCHKIQELFVRCTSIRIRRKKRFLFSCSQMQICMYWEFSGFSDFYFVIFGKFDFFFYFISFISRLFAKNIFFPFFEKKNFC